MHRPAYISDHYLDIDYLKGCVGYLDLRAPVHGYSRRMAIVITLTDTTGRWFVSISILKLTSFN